MTLPATGYPSAIIAAGPAALAAWDDFTAGEGFRASTRSLYRGAALRFLRWLEPQGIVLAEVTPRLVERFLEQQDVAPNSKGMYRTAVRRFFDALVAQNAVPSNPADQAGRGTNDPLREAPPALAELKAFLHDLAGIDEGSESFRPGLVAMYPIIVGGMDPKEIAVVTGIPLPEIELYAGRLRENGIWTPDGKVAVDFDNPESAEAIVELALQIGCARGVFACFRGPDDAGSVKQGDPGDGRAGESP